jgi:hypothetical protein
VGAWLEVLGCSSRSYHLRVILFMITTLDRLRFTYVLRYRHGF